MQLSTSTVRRTVGTPPEPASAAPAWATPAVAVSAVAAAGAVAVGALEARLPVGPGGSSFHHVYPFVFAALGLGSAVLAARTARRSGDRGWLRLLAAGGVGYALNALVIAALMYAVTPQGAGLPLRALAWVEGWLWMPADVIMIGLLVLLLPGGRRPTPSLVTARVAGGLVAAGMLLNAFAQPVMENTDKVANPLAVHALAPLGDFGDLACLLALAIAMLAGLVRHIGLLIRRDPVGRRVGRRGLPLALAMVVLFVVTGALTADDAPLTSNLITGAVILLGIGSVAVVGSRLARD